MLIGCVQLFQLTLSDQSSKLKDIFKKAATSPFDILTFLSVSSKWLAIEYLHWTDDEFCIDKFCIVKRHGQLVIIKVTIVSLSSPFLQL